MKSDDRVRIQHMLDAARDALSFVEGRTREDLDVDRQLVLAVVKSVEIIGEAASQVSPESQTELGALPWPEMVAMRNRLVHAYYDVNHDVVWSTVQDDLPPLVDGLQRALESR